TDGVYTQLLNIRPEDADAEFIANVVTSSGKNKKSKSGQSSTNQMMRGGMGGGMGGRPMMR
ncbi:MAG: hypothetical protein II707_05395, partial [Spirochaetales bacterium]|nr:hypothetical protein [Spirochaetales bacterium]